MSRGHDHHASKNAFAHTPSNPLVLKRPQEIESAFDAILTVNQALPDLGL
ncbi:MAG: hypothetical protein ACOYKA_04970 [Legionellaceae bacterium]